MSELSEYTAQLTPEQREHVAVLRRKFFRAVSVFSIVGVIVFMVVMRFTMYNYSSVEDYEQYITHKDKFMRFNAAKALGQFKGNPKAVVLLTQLLNDPAREVKWHAAASLSKLKDPKAIPALSRLVHKEKDVSAKSIIIYALGQIQNEDAIDPLYEELTNSLKQKNLEKIKDERVIQFSIVQALAYIDKEKSKTVLLELKNRTDIDKELRDFTQQMISSKGQVKNQN